MGSCWCKVKTLAEADPSQVVMEEASSVSQETADVTTMPPNTATQNHKELISHYILQIVHVVATHNQGYVHPVPLTELHKIAENEIGWNQVIHGIVSTVPLEDPLCASSIIIIVDDCPLPAMDTVLSTLKDFNICRERALACNSLKVQRFERNILVVLGCFAEKFVGFSILNQDIMEYIYTFLAQKHMPDMVLQALCTVEKFGKIKRNKLQFQEFFAKQPIRYVLMTLEHYMSSNDPIWHQIGFAAQWLLDNMFLVEERPLTYTVIDMSNIHAMLDTNNTTDLLKISASGLEARCDSQTFESVSCTFEVTQGCYYYEVEVLTRGVMQIGWVTKTTRFSNHEGFGVGDDKFSLAYDGCRCMLWHQAAARRVCAKPWVPGDVLGCLIDLSAQETVFFLNGVGVNRCKDLFQYTSVGFYAAASFMSGQSARFNFGNREFRFRPKRSFNTFNENGILTVEEKQVIPHWLVAKRLQAEEENATNSDAVCIICYDNVANTTISPCSHRGFCLECAMQLSECPYCRGKVWYCTMTTAVAPPTTAEDAPKQDNPEADAPKQDKPEADAPKQGKPEADAPKQDKPEAKESM